MIKLEALRVFVTVAEAGNIKDAAEQLCRTASAISMTLKQLEEQIGGALFETDRKNSLTTLGSFMLETGQAQINNYDRAIGKIHAFAQSKIGRLSLASVPSVAANFVPTLLPGFVADRPGIEVELFDLDSRNVRRVVESGQADIGISGEPALNSLVSFEPLFRDRFKVICSSKSCLGQANRLIDWSDLEGETLIINGASEQIASPAYRKLSEKASFTVLNVTSLVALTKAGLGVTLLPALSTTDLPDGVVALDFADENIERMVGLLTRKGGTPSPVAIAFHDYLLNHTPGLVKQLNLTPAK